MNTCNICGKEFETGQQLGGHKAHHNVQINLKISKSKTLKRVIIIKQCERCNKDFTVTRILNKDGSQRINKDEKRFCNRSCANFRVFTKEQNQKKGRRGKLNSSWKGVLLKSIQCSSCGKEIGCYSKYGFCRHCLGSQSFFRKLLSNSLKGKTGGPRKGGGHSKSGWYKGYWCDSSWELAYVMYSIDHDISFKRNEEGFPYVFEGKSNLYYPDFIVNNQYVEIKGYITERWKAKQKCFPYNLTVINEHSIRPYILYAEETYGKEFICHYGV